MKKIKIYKKIKIPIYKGTFHFFITNSSKFLSKELGVERDEKDEIYASTYRREHEDASSTLAIALNPRHSTSKLDYGVIAHEAQHASYFLLKCRGMELTYESEEAFNYLTEWFVNEMVNVFNENKIKI